MSLSITKGGDMTGSILRVLAFTIAFGLLLIGGVGLLAGKDDPRDWPIVAQCRGMYGRARSATDSLIVDGTIVETNGYGGRPMTCVSLRKYMTRRA